MEDSRVMETKAMGDNKDLIMMEINKGTEITVQIITQITSLIHKTHISGIHILINENDGLQINKKTANQSNMKYSINYSCINI